MAEISQSRGLIFCELAGMNSLNFQNGHVNAFLLDTDYPGSCLTNGLRGYNSSQLRIF